MKKVFLCANLVFVLIWAFQRCAIESSDKDQSLNLVNIIDSIRLKQVQKNDPLFLASIKFTNKLKYPVLIDLKKEYLISIAEKEEQTHSVFFLNNKNYTDSEFVEPFKIPFYGEGAEDSLKRYLKTISKFNLQEDTTYKYLFQTKQYIKLKPGQSFQAFRIFKFYVNDYDYLLNNKNETCIMFNFFVLRENEKFEKAISKLCNYSIELQQ